MKSRLLTILFPLLLACQGVQPVSVLNLSVSQLVKIYQEYPDLLVLFVDTNTTSSVQFLGQIRTVIEVINRKYSWLSIALCDKYTSDSDENLVFEKFDIMLLPAMVYFKHGVQTNMKKNRNISTRRLFNFLNRMATRQPIVADDFEQLQILNKEESRAKLVFYTEDASLQERMVGLACKYPGIIFVQAAKRQHIEELMKQLTKGLVSSLSSPSSSSPAGDNNKNERNTLIAGVHKHDGTMIQLDSPKELSLQVVEKFIEALSRPQWTFLCKRSFSRMKRVEKDFLLFFFDPTSQRDMQTVEMLRVSLQPYFDDVELLLAVRHCRESSRYAEMIGLPDPQRFSDSRLFQVRYVGLDKFEKHKSPENMQHNEEAVLRFVFDSMDRKTPRHIKTEEDYYETILWNSRIANWLHFESFEGWGRATSKTFEAEVLGSSMNNTLVFFVDSDTDVSWTNHFHESVPKTLGLVIVDTRLNESDNFPRDCPGTVWLYTRTPFGQVEQELTPKEGNWSVELRLQLMKLIPN